MTPELPTVSILGIMQAVRIALPLAIAGSRAQSVEKQSGNTARGAVPEAMLPMGAAQSAIACSLKLVTVSVTGCKGLER